MHKYLYIYAYIYIYIYMVSDESKATRQNPLISNLENSHPKSATIHPQPYTRMQVTASKAIAYAPQQNENYILHKKYPKPRF